MGRHSRNHSHGTCRYHQADLSRDFRGTCYHRYILNGTYNNKEYNTISTLRVAWEADYSPFSKSFDKTYLKRIRAYDNNGKDFDIEYSFKKLEKTRYISDGDINTIVIKKDDEKYLNPTLSAITY